MIFAHRVVTSMPELFTQIEKFVLQFNTKNKTRHADIFLWRYEGSLPKGESELQIIIPTAKIEINPKDIK